ncbi:hypothetical protein DEJ31_06875 [Curtobacterium sp. MCPF17_031]|nr:hypothetical protein DEI89_16270 [Curtobacterium sp. MCBD17_030]PZE37849.1 hypothetical protein DEJ31_06875 [Curtobacterium sp. MCPF17_031]
MDGSSQIVAAKSSCVEARRQRVANPEGLRVERARKGSWLHHLDSLENAAADRADDSRSLWRTT